MRCCYSKPGRHSLMFVIAEVLADGREEFAEQESGESRWHPFTPSPEERAAVACWLKAGAPPVGWPLLPSKSAGETR